MFKEGGKATSNVRRLDSLEPRLYKAETSLLDGHINRSNLLAISIVINIMCN